MSQFPVEDQTGMLEGVNYLLSGPAGLGQNFQGFSSYTPVYIKPTVRAPFTLPIDTAENPNWTVAPIAIGNMVPQGNVASTNSVLLTYASTPSPAPFTAGDVVDVKDVNPSFYDGSYTVLNSTSTELLLGTNRFFDYTGKTYVSGGDVYRDWSDQLTSTDCNAFVNILGPTDQAFISAQIKLDYSWTANTAGSEFDIVVTIDRLRGSAVIDQNATAVQYSDQYLFQTDATVSFQRVHKTVSAPGSESTEFIFTTALDTPGFGYYWYILDVKFVLFPDYNASEVGGDPVIGFARSLRFTYSGNIDVATQITTNPTSYLAVTGTPITGGASPSLFDVYLYPTQGNVAVTLYSSNNVEVYNNGGVSPPGYTPGDQILILGSDIGGVSPDNDLTLTVSKVLYGGDALPGNVKATLRSLTAQVVKE